MIPVTPEKLEQLIRNAEAEGVSAEKLLPLQSRLKELRSGIFGQQDSSKVRYKEIQKKGERVVYYSTASTLTDNKSEEDEFEDLEMRSIKDSSQTEDSVHKVVYSYPNSPKK